MQEKEKQLLLIDLCARLPYGVKCYEEGVEYTLDIIGFNTNNKEFIFSDGYERNLEQIKPYLRPMSSMTKEERIERIAILLELEGHIDEDVTYKYQDWLLAHHLDFRNLIGQNLALEAPDGMYKNA